MLTSKPAQYRGAHVISPLTRETSISWVDLEFPARSGLKAKLEAEGYDIGWRRDDKPRGDDAKPVMGEEHGIDFVYKVRDLQTALTLYKWRRKPH